jgi:tetratricopeptide (TPR) repeat protein
MPKKTKAEKFFDESRFRREQLLAINELSKALAVASKKGDLNEEAKICYQIADLYESIGEFEHALTYYLSEYQISKITSNNSSICSALTNLALLYSRAGEYPKAIEYGEKATQFSDCHKCGEEESVRAYFNLGDIHFIVSFCDEYFSDHVHRDLALEYTMKSLELHQKAKGIVLIS